MVALSPVAGSRLRTLYQPMLLDFQMRMRFPVGRSGYGLQYPHGSLETLPVLRPWVAGTGCGDARDYRPASSDCLEGAVEMGPPDLSVACDVSGHGRACSIGSRVVGRVLEPLGLADSQPIPAYLNCLWCWNPPTFYSLQWSSGLPLRSSMAAEADAAAVCAFPPSNSTRFRAATIGSGLA